MTESGQRVRSKPLMQRAVTRESKNQQCESMVAIPIPVDPYCFQSLEPLVASEIVVCLDPVGIA